MAIHRDRRATPSVRKKAPAASRLPGEGRRLRCLLARSFHYATALRALPTAFSGQSRPLPIGHSNPRSRDMTITHLGQSSSLPASPEEAVLDYVPNPRIGKTYLVRFTAPEFTSLCPVTAQPDFAHIVIDYVPGDMIVESKSLKLFLGSFRNHAAFHEDCTVGIGERLVAEMKPRWLRIGGYWYPRGGIPIDVFWQTGAPPADLWLPDQGVAPYRGRG